MSIIEFTIEGGITGTANALDLAACKKHVDEGARRGQADTANENLLLRRLASIQVDGKDAFDGELELARRRCPTLANRVADILTAAAGAPLIPPASKMIDILDADTPEGVLRAASLTREKAEELIAGHTGYPLHLIQVRNIERVKIFAGVIRAPDPDEVALVTNAYRNGKGLADAFLSLCDACIPWAREPKPETWQRWPGVPLHVLGYEIAELAGGSADLRFRERR